MSEKRKDNKNRILHIGESQRKDGSYMFKYTDANRDEKALRQWFLKEISELYGKRIYNYFYNFCRQKYAKLCQFTPEKGAKPSVAEKGRMA